MRKVEAYDYNEDKWTYLPKMVEEKFNYASASMVNKLFVIRGVKTTNCEIFDRCSWKFTSINSEILPDLKEMYFYAFSICNNILVFLDDSTDTVVYLYDVDKEKMSNFQCEFTKNMFGSKYVKYFT